MRILLDENLPRKLLAALRAENHEVESVHTLRMQLWLTLGQKPQDEFVTDFISAFKKSDLGLFRHGDDWP